MPLVEELSHWTCPYCDKKNDHTNPVRCWNCNKKKLSLKKYLALIKRRAREALAKQKEVKKEIIAKIDAVEPKTDQPLEFDLSKLKS